MKDEKDTLLREIDALKKQVDEMRKKINFLEAVQEHYTKETAYFSNIETKIKDLLMTVNDRNNLTNSLDYALRLYNNHESNEEKEN